MSIRRLETSKEGSDYDSPKYNSFIITNSKYSPKNFRVTCSFLCLLIMGVIFMHYIISKDKHEFMTLLVSAFILSTFRKILFILAHIITGHICNLCKFIYKCVFMFLNDFTTNFHFV